MAIMTPPSAVILSPELGLMRLSGTTVVAGSPDASIGSIPVFLVRSIQRLLTIRRTISSPTGAWVFDRIVAPRTADGGYVTIAFDPAKAYDPACKTNLIPSPMPPDPAEHLP